MRYDHSELMRQLGAEYVMGTLQGAARRRFERLLGTNEEARAQVAFWEQRLSEFGQVLHPVGPPAAAREELLRRLGSEDVSASTPIPRRPVNRRRHRLHWALPYMAGFASAAALMLAFLLGQRENVTLLPQAPSQNPAAEVVTRDPGTEYNLPMYVAQVRMPASSMGWLLSVSEDHRKLQVTASDDYFQAGRNRVQLWCVVPGQEPIPLGPVPLERDVTESFDIPAAVEGADEVSFAITLEPEDLPQTSKPSRPVLSSAAALDAI